MCCAGSRCCTASRCWSGSRVADPPRKIRICHVAGRSVAPTQVFYCRRTRASTLPRPPRRTCCPRAHVLITVLHVQSYLTHKTATRPGSIQGYLAHEQLCPPYAPITDVFELQVCTEFPAQSSLWQDKIYSGRGRWPATGPPRGNRPGPSL